LASLLALPFERGELFAQFAQRMQMAVVSLSLRDELAQ